MNIDMIRAAAARLAGHVRQTPLLSSPFLDQIAGRRVLVKAECLQHTGSFKYRGGYAAVSTLDKAALAGGVWRFRRAITRRVWRWRPPSMVRQRLS